MAIQIGERPSPTFAQPLELLSDCHRRIERFLAVLIRVTMQAGGRSLDEREREAIQVALKYFREAAPKHTADEEESLFPRMKNSGKCDAALEQLAALEKDHEEANILHAEVDRLATRWLNEDSLSQAVSELLLGSLEKLQTIYQRHIAVEDREIFPIAARELQAGEIQEVGREMAARRGQNLLGRMNSPGKSR
jgi:hemerythrin-like domain-containing protein